MLDIRNLVSSSLTILAVAGYAQLSAAATTYRITPVGLGDGDGASLNNLGVVVSQSGPYIWSEADGQQPTYLSPSALFASNYGINDNNAVVGQAYEPDPENVGQYQYTGYYIDSAGLFYRISDARSALDVSINGRVVGGAVDGSAYIWDAVNGFLSIGQVTGKDRTFAGAVNKHGDVVGSGFSVEFDGRFPFVSSAGYKWTEKEGMVLLAGGLESDAKDINNDGYIAGSFRGFAAVWDELLNLEVLPGLTSDIRESTAVAINDGNQTVGYGKNSEGRRTAILWENGVAYDLNLLIDPNDPLYGLVGLYQSFDINNSGQILVEGRGVGDINHYLLSPVSVPVPGALVLFLSCMGSVFLVKRGIK